MKPLHLKGVPMRGPDGKRDNLDRILAVLNAVMPPSLVAFAHVQHDDGCPCLEGEQPLSAIIDCTCETVDLKLEAIPKEEKHG